MTQVVLVDQNDNPVGAMEKIEAHRKGVLHRALSVLLYNSKHELLLQRRAPQKYHSGGLWTNTCCSHPMPGESMDQATQRCLLDEMGIHILPKFSFKFIYKARLDDHLVEHELDHVFIGEYDGVPIINKDEVSEWKFVGKDALRQDMENNPGDYSHWFKLIMASPELQKLF